MRLTILFLLLSSASFSQTPLKKAVKADIKEVTVFLEGAQIRRSGSVNVVKGKTSLVIKKLSPYVDEKSVQVKAIGNFTILSVNNKVNFLDELMTNQRLDSIDDAIDEINNQLTEHTSRNEVLVEKIDLLDQNKVLTGENSSLSLTQLRDAINFFDREMTSIKKEQLALGRTIKLKKAQLQQLEREKVNGNSRVNKATSEIVINIEANASTKAEFEISYLVRNAGWFPKYDIRASSVDAPIRIDYKASVYQNTGNNWNDVKLSFSNGNPNEGGTAPELNTWFLNYARLSSYRSTQSVSSPGFIVGRITSSEDGSTLPGVNVVVKGTTIGTVSDINGRYSIARPRGAVTLVYSFIGLASEEIGIGSRGVVDVQMSPDVMQLSELVVLQGKTAGVNVTARGISRNKNARGYSTMNAEINETEVIENQTTVEIEVSEPYSVKSNGEQIQVDLKKYEINALFEYYAVPKLDKDAFLIAKITDWDQYNFLAGEANLYFEGAYVGRSILNAQSLQDTLDISLGRDKSIVINRIKKDELSKKKFMGSNITESRTYTVDVRNRKSSLINLTLIDQVPKPITSDISVDVLELSGGIHNEKSGEVKWELELAPQSKKSLTFGYEVKYPKRERVILD